MSVDIGQLVTKALLAIKELERKADVNKAFINKEAEKFRKQIPEKVGKLLLDLAKKPELQKLALHGSESEQLMKLEELRENFNLQTSPAEQQSMRNTLEKEAKAKIPSAEKLWNKKVERLPGYAMYASDRSATLEKSHRDPYPGMSDSEAREAAKRDMASSMRQYQHHLLSKVGSSPPSFSPQPNPQMFTTLQKGNPEGFLEECIRQRTSETGASESEAREWCQQFMEQQLGLKPEGDEDRVRRLEEDYDDKLKKGSRLRFAKDIFEEQQKKKRHWLESQKKSGLRKEKAEDGSK